MFLKKKWPTLFFMILLANSVFAYSVTATEYDDGYLYEEDYEDEADEDADDYESFPGESTEDFLNRFYGNPKEVMNDDVPKYDNEGNIVSDRHQLFHRHGIISPDEVSEAKDYVQELVRSSATEKALVAEDFTNEEGFLVTDRAENFVDNAKDDFVTNIVEMEKRKLTKAKLKSSPWSSDYWPIYMGMAAFRYADPKTPSMKDKWIDFYKFSNEVKVPNRSMTDKEIAKLSPAEKYDILVGDYNFTLTRAMWNVGKGYYDSQGNVPEWMGICNGWAAASFTLDRPRYAIKVKSYDGKHKIKFYPEDIKALASLLFAYGQTENKFIGTRCESKHPKVDQYGRYIDQACFDTNPATWHLAMVNQVGVSERGLVFDKSVDDEVWNQPAYAYTYKYFNPEKGKSSKNLKEAMIPYSEFKRDVFKSYRSPDVKNIVGVEMAVKYVVEVEPMPRRRDRKRYDGIRTVVYRYDLELDDKHEIIGGEWYGNKHPDFIWAPVKGSIGSSSYEDEAVGSWKSRKRSLPDSWARAGMRSSLDSVPLGKIVYRLLEFSRSGKILSRLLPPKPHLPRFFRGS